MPTKIPKYGPKPGSHLVMVLPDLHFPYHDPAALQAALDAHALYKPKKTIILGDWLDCTGFSAHAKKSKKELLSGSFKDTEVDPCRRTLDKLEKNTQEIIYLEGNHEFRVERMILQYPDILAAVEDLINPKLLLSEGRKKPFTWVSYVPNGQILSHYRIANDLIAVHGWTHAKNAAAKMVSLSKKWSIIYGHTHRQQLDSDRDPIDGAGITAWSPGCLSKLQPLYMHSTPTSWRHGFSLIWVKNDLSNWTQYTVTINNGICVLPDGRKIDGNR